MNYNCCIFRSSLLSPLNGSLSKCSPIVINSSVSKCAKFSWTTVEYARIGEWFQLAKLFRFPSATTDACRVSFDFEFHPFGWTHLYAESTRQWDPPTSRMSSGQSSKMAKWMTLSVVCLFSYFFSSAFEQSSPLVVSASSGDDDAADDPNERLTHLNCKMLYSSVHVAILVRLLLSCSCSPPEAPEKLVRFLRPPW